ncbi:MAG: hypothetical protein U0361_15895 [Nitrospiraceae bacterium]
MRWIWTGGIRVRLTQEVGYDGGAFFSPDGKRIVYRAQHPENQQELEQYQSLLAQNLVEPGRLELFIMNADGSGKQQVTRNGASNFYSIFSSGRHAGHLLVQRGARSGSERPGVPPLPRQRGRDGSRSVLRPRAFQQLPPCVFPRREELVWVSDRHAKGRESSTCSWRTGCLDDEVPFGLDRRASVSSVQSDSA